MRLNWLRLRDFGLYRGEQTIDLAPRKKRGAPRPVVLVGGHNGAGKTTILDALRLCLYGRLALGDRVTDGQYREYLRERIHRDAGALIQMTSAGVACSFDYARGGVRSTFIVERSWEALQNGKVSETVEVLKDGEPLDEVESNFWEDFVRSLVPPGVSQLFFFDGEQIKRLAEEATEAETLAESVKALLGLDLVERLQADLDLYVARQLRKGGKREHRKRLEEIEEHASRLRDERASLETEAQVVEHDVEQCNSDVASLGQRLNQAGQGLAEQRNDLRDRAKELEVLVDVHEKRIRALADTALPFALCPDLSRALLRQLDGEAKLENWEAGQENIKDALKTVTRRLTTGKTSKALNASARSHIREELRALSTELTKRPAKLARTEIIHGIASQERDRLRRVLVKESAEVQKELAKAVKELTRLERDLHDVKVRLNQAPDNDELAPIFADLTARQHEKADLEAKLAVVREKQHRLDNDLAALHRERVRLEKAQSAEKGMAERIDRARTARGVLDEYHKELTQAKVGQLQAELLESFSQLARKNDLIGDIKIDAATFEVTLYDKKSRELPKASLSAGEKQIYAIALLWALARVSGRPLPMVVDTPLGRLDSIHRQKLIEHYFPLAAHQVVILSTDTEVDRRYFDQLSPHTSHALSLVTEDGATKVKPGYFWKEETRAAANV